ncbi:hypothetical protein SBBP2_580002 [Burkholderiales bacterium]|nr:hypothetical protein SBBP2_580002 [Burkholderiales bacterium]
MAARGLRRKAPLAIQFRSETRVFISWKGSPMPSLRPEIDPDGLLEYSVVFTDRSLNHMSQKFQRVMRDISGVLKEVYRARSAIIVPGGGTAIGGRRSSRWVASRPSKAC